MSGSHSTFFSELAKINKFQVDRHTNGSQVQGHHLLVLFSAFSSIDFRGVTNTEGIQLKIQKR
jgi:hypothetical protein